MAIETPLHFQLLCNNVKRDVANALVIQQFNPYHIARCTLGDRSLRDDFHLLQNLYTRALGMPLESLRECMDFVTIEEMRGFGVEPITRCPESENHGNHGNSMLGAPRQPALEHWDRALDEITQGMANTNLAELETNLAHHVPEYLAPRSVNNNDNHDGDSMPHINEEGPSQPIYEDLDKAIAEITEGMANTSLAETETNPSHHVPESLTHGSTGSADTRDQDSVTSGFYDDAGFYVAMDIDDTTEPTSGQETPRIDDGDDEMVDLGSQETREDDDDEEMTDLTDELVSHANAGSQPLSWADEVDAAIKAGELPAMSQVSYADAPSQPLSWADEVDAAIQAGELPSMSQIPSNSSSTTSIETSPSRSWGETSFFDTDLALRVHELSLEQQHEDPRTQPLSEALRILVAAVGGNPDTTAPARPVSMTDDEFTVSGLGWVGYAHDANDAGDNGVTPREAERLDGWDAAHCWFYWQTEGLFLARLTQVVYKERFELARRLYWAGAKEAPRSAYPRVERRVGEKLPGSSLRREVKRE
ncbi:hypothetical protein F4802DRAFT_620794 [Xylaria palmicola]|nr:hypothetical protein F4802DRAFT_620794 [Xylaria palmicola]